MAVQRWWAVQSTSTTFHAHSVRTRYSTENDDGVNLLFVRNFSKSVGVTAVRLRLFEPYFPQHTTRQAYSDPAVRQYKSPEALFLVARNAGVAQRRVISNWKRDSSWVGSANTPVHSLQCPNGVTAMPANGDPKPCLP